jgi:hypothetical protein
MSAQYFAQVNENNEVIFVSVVTKEFLESNPERYPGRWIETFYDTPGKTYAGVGYIWNETTQDFEVPPAKEMKRNES